MACRKFEKQMSPYIDNMLTERKKAAFESHVSSCPRCKRELEELKALVSNINSLPFEAVPDNLHQKSMEAIRNATAYRKVNNPAFNYKRLVPVAASLLLFFVIATGALLSLENASRLKSGSAMPAPAAAPAAAEPQEAAPPDIAPFAAAGLYSGESVTVEGIAEAEEGYIIEDTLTGAYSLDNGGEYERKHVLVLPDQQSNYMTDIAPESIESEIVIKTASLEICVEDIELVSKEIESLPVDVEFAKVSWGNATFTLRVDTYNWENILSQIASMGVTWRERRGQSEATDQYRENCIRLLAKNEEIAALTQLISSANNIEDILAIENQLSRLEQDVINTKAVLANYYNESVNPCIYVELSLQENIAKETQPFSQRLRRGFVSSFNLTGLTFETIAVVIARLSVPIIIVISAAFWLMKRRRGK